MLPADVNVFATTASNATTSSYACYFDKARKTFLGDVYSIKWLEDSDKENIEKETLEQQYTVVKKETNTSMVSNKCVIKYCIVVFRFVSLETWTLVRCQLGLSKDQNQQSGFLVQHTHHTYVKS